MLRQSIPARHAQGHSRRALQFFGLALLAALSACLLGSLLGRSFGRVPSTDGVLRFPRVFWLSTGLLWAGSYALQRALTFVKLEKQRPFRRWLWWGWAIGVTFSGVQGYALWCLLPAERTAEAAQLGAIVFILMLATLHALHFLVAVLFLSFVIVLAISDRYDHEYHWGVSFCVWFWHALGIAWMLVLAIIAIAYR